MKEKHVKDCYKYTLKRLEELSAQYDEQVNNIETLALWNLPTELCDDWYNMEYFINVLYDNKKIDDNIKTILVQINQNFKKCTNEVELTHNRMKYSEFWAKQRKLAKQALLLMNK
ncbi:MAG: hypothetical protein IJA76_01110 [Clostridia bacterium]|nr:hypothetical protein [Clostridia bacterium]